MCVGICVCVCVCVCTVSLQLQPYHSGNVLAFATAVPELGAVRRRMNRPRVVRRRYEASSLAVK